LNLGQEQRSGRNPKEPNIDTIPSNIVNTEIHDASHFQMTLSDRI